MKNMRIKLILLITVCLLGGLFVAYRQYSSLRNINSYLQCSSSWGSIIETSYPAVCVTKLGSRFTEKISNIPQNEPDSPYLPQETHDAYDETYYPGQKYTSDVYGFSITIPKGWYYQVPATCNGGKNCNNTQLEAFSYMPAQIKSEKDAAAIPNKMKVEIYIDTFNKLSFDDAAKAQLRDAGQAVQSYNYSELNGQKSIEITNKAVAGSWSYVHDYLFVNNKSWKFGLLAYTDNLSIDATPTVADIVNSFVISEDNKDSVYTCPTSEWVDCMPTPDVQPRPQCESAYLNWAKSHCPGFQGAAL